MSKTIVTARPPARLPEELVASTAFLLKRLGFLAKEESLEAFDRLGLTPSHYGILAVLDEGSRETQGAIADALGYDRGQLVGFLDELEEQGLVERQRDPDDRRRHIVRLTPSGRRMLEKFRALAAKLEEEFLTPLEAQERAELHRLLLRLAERHLPRCARTT